MGREIELSIGGKTVGAALNDTATSNLFWERLPMKVTLQRWGDEYYGECGLAAPREKGAKTDMDVGELAIWPDGSALCIFFGPTPASRDERPRAVSPVNPIGKIAGDVGFLKKLGGTVTAEVRRKA